MKPFSHPDADLFIPDELDADAALKRCTHLAVGAHQDDLEIFAYHGIAACFGRSDRWFGGVTVTDGAGSSRTGIYADHTDEEMKAIRRHEQRKAAYVGEYGIQIQLGHPSKAVKSAAASSEVVDDLEIIFRGCLPDVLYLHNPVDKHDTHVGLLLRCLDALRRLPKEQRPAKVYGCEVWRDLDWLLEKDKVVLPVDDYPNLAASLVALFDSQITGGKRYDLATAGRRLANATYHDSHASDQHDALSWAMDLTPVVHDDSLDVMEHALSYIERLKHDVQDRFRRLS